MSVKKQQTWKSEHPYDPNYDGYHNWGEGCKISYDKKQLKRIKKEQEIIQQCIEQQMKYHANNQW